MVFHNWIQLFLLSDPKNEFTPSFSFTTFSRVSVSNLNLVFYDRKSRQTAKETNSVFTYDIQITGK